MCKTEEEKLIEKSKAYDWIISLIDSCKNEFHFESAGKVIAFFNQKFSDNDKTLELNAYKIIFQKRMQKEMRKFNVSCAGEGIEDEASMRESN